MAEINADISGIQRLQDANLRAAAAFQPGGALGRRVLDGAIYLHRAAVAFTHVDTGALKASHRVDFAEIVGEGAIGVIFIDPTTRNPVSRQRPAEYGVYEHRRGGEHAFYTLAIQSAGEATAAGIIDGLSVDLRGG